ncbi:hypothetical protein PPERSA_06836 [Pseudocohnilembus persalinus]|uniref:Uncharacterized protein n=1 Tax=Pseudocohnilembus persalinus TaxID=266149 RepID=A0A0V0QSD3_PSEPJ|nr:hypothetical protein PPERSA_06836 [Pseudocohnilembus persalinus]|eukprot:KRX05202.1 hypothetical protein PPERSA_06836 [Pseudocohnilembus persalinus]
MNEEYHELIIENGFLIYTLVNLYLENYKIDQQEEEDDEMNEYLNEFKREQEEKGLFGKDNIFGQLVSLGDGLVQAGLKKRHQRGDQIFQREFCLDRNSEGLKAQYNYFSAFAVLQIVKIGCQK